MPKSPSQDRINLMQQWQASFKCPPPVQSNTDFLRQAVSWQQQANKLGGLDGFCRKMLKRSAVNKTLAPGTQLIRQWQHASYQVTVMDKGFEYNGKISQLVSNC